MLPTAVAGSFSGHVLMYTSSFVHHIKLSHNGPMASHVIPQWR